MKLKTMLIKGKEYVTVNERIRYFNETYPKGSISTLVTFEGNYARCKAIIWPDASILDRYFTGHAEEDRKQGMVNSTSACENAETSAVGRALGMMGIGINDSVASAEEVVSAIHKQTTAPKPAYTGYKAPQS